MRKIISLILIIIIVTYMIPNTYSWICNNYYKNIRVSAAKQDNIIEKIEIAEVNPEKIILKRAQSINYTPVIFFNIDGEINNYIHGINPVKIYEEDSIIPINFVFGPLEMLDLFDNNEPITGTISIKHLNEYISIDKNVIFTKNFLLEKLSEQAKSCQNKINEQKINNIKEYLHKNNIIFNDNNFVQSQKPPVY